jgi:hypothetical protein
MRKSEEEREVHEERDLLFTNGAGEESTASQDELSSRKDDSSIEVLPPWRPVVHPVRLTGRQSACRGGTFGDKVTRRRPEREPTGLRQKR